MGIRHNVIAPVPDDPTDDRLQGEAWNADHQLPAIAEPADPDTDESVIWMSNGTGEGDVGDIMGKINNGGDIRTGTILDFSSLTPPSADTIITEDGDTIITEDGDTLIGE